MNKNTFVLLISFLFIVAYATAQQRTRRQSKSSKTVQTESEQKIPKVLSMKSDAFSFIPADEQRRDLNGDICALVKVQVLDDFTEESSSIGEVLHKGSEKWVYMAKGSKRMKLFFKNNLPLTVSFSDYQINGLESNKVYTLVVEVPNMPPTPGQVGPLRIKVTPENATVIVWSDKMERRQYATNEEGQLEASLPWGRYYYRASASGFSSAEGSVFVNDEGKWENIVLTEIKGSLVVTCPTKKAQLVVNGKILLKSKKDTHWTGQLAPGQYKVVVQRKGYVSQSQDVIIRADETTTVKFDNLITKFDQEIIDKKKRKQLRKEAKREEEAKAVALVNEKKDNNKAPNLVSPKPAKNNSVKNKNTSSREDNVVVFGARAGVNLSSLGLNSDADGSCSMVTSFHAGMNADVTLSKQFHLNVSLFFSQKGYKYEHDWDSERQESVTAQFLMLPIQLSYRINQFQINAGPYIDYGLGGNIEYGIYDNTNDTFDYYDSFNYGLIVGGGVLLGKRFYIGANYEMGLSDYANRNISLSIGYNF